MVGWEPTIAARVYIYNMCTKHQGWRISNKIIYISVRRLYCTRLVPRTRSSSDGEDDSDSGEWIHLKRGVDHGGCGLIGLRGHCIMLCGGVRPPSGGSGGARYRGWSKGRPCRVEAALMCPDSLRLPIYARNPHINLGRSEIQ
ncbi:hypothetical protein M9H77_03749 [Catharanthus roseus]|uniref:Uncharacterized protein n=1 Tax=Catharanthus roseus TaxID=4058 RepID=A0ACC0CC52_CATRO|nr:hypothetical protein M9H77_03749 [Catharanthus roseus]